MDGRVTWTEFLDYFAGVSLAIEDEDFFELTMRNAIKVRACVRARVCVWPVVLHILACCFCSRREALPRRILRTRTLKPVASR